MLASLVGVQAASGLLLRGAGDLWAQSAVLLALIAGLALWISAGAVRGRLELPSRAPAAWAAALSAGAFVSARFSPVPGYALPAWAAAAAGLWTIPAATLLSARARSGVEQAVRAAAWALVLLAVDQRLHGQPRPPSAFLDHNVFAGAILLLLPFAARRGDGLLAAGLLLCLWWTRSVGAWLGLAAALVLHRREVGSFAFWAGVAAGVIALGVACAKLQSPEAARWWAWSSSSWRMARDAPWRGLGPGAFVYALPAYAPARLPLGETVARQYFLETAAERGWPYLFLWLGGIAALLRRAPGSKRFGPVAALIHGLFGYALSVPGVFWLFCLSISWTLPESDGAVAMRGGRKLLAALALALCVEAVDWVSGNWEADRLRRQAFAQSARPLSAPAALRLFAASEDLRPHPEAALARAQIEIALAAGADSLRLLNAAAGDLERAVSLDPYRVSNWATLEEVYRRLGRPEDAARARARGARACPSLRAAAA